MLFIQKRYNKKRGFTLIEALVLLFIFSIITVTFYRVFASSARLSLEAKKRLIAINVANERMEAIRSLGYDEVGVISGSPEGGIDSDEYIQSGGYEYHLLTSITYKDDPDDGLSGGSPADETPNDYKEVEVTALWGSEGEKQRVSLYSTVSPFGSEVSIEGGALSVTVLDINGNPVDGASVNIYNDNVVPAINQTITSNSSGTASLYGLSPYEQGYIVTVTKSTYESASTFPPYPTTPYYPIDVHTSVVDGEITNSVIQSSELSDIQIKFEDAYSGNVSDVNFSLTGGRILGTDTDGDFVYNFDDTFVSDSAGVKNINDISPGPYVIIVNESSHIFWKTNLGTGNNINEIVVDAGENSQTKNVKLVDKSRDSYFLKVLDGDTGNPIENASVNLQSSALLYSTSQQTDEYGYVYFPASPDLLVNGETYEVEVTAPGYTTESNTVIISQLIQQELLMNPL